MYLLEGLQHIGRSEVDAQGTSLGDAPVTPGPLKYVGKRQEIEDDILVCQGKYGVLVEDDGLEHEMRQHDALTHPRRTAGIEDVGQVGLLQFRRALLYLLRVRITLPHPDEFAEIDADLVLRVLHHGLVRDDKALHRGTHHHDAESHVVLVLLSHEDITDVGVVDHVLHLKFAAGGIEGDADGPDGIAPEIDIEILHHVLREHGHVFLYAHAPCQEGIGHGTYLGGKLVP